jgi:alpha/beta superfamily hydrolase
MRMEQPSTIPFLGEEGELGMVLEGLYVPGSADEGGALIAPPHPLYGGSVLNPVVTELALRCQTLGITSLRFNWRGVGASAGEQSGDDAASDADYEASLRFMEECVDGIVIACGYSWGAAAAHRVVAGHPAVRKLVLIAPPAQLLDVAKLEAFPGNIFIAVGENDTLADPSAIQAIAAKLKRTECVVLKDCDHFFGAGTNELGRAFEAWLR